MKWALEHGTTDPEILKSLTYFIMAYKFGFTPKQVDEMPATLVEEFLVLLKKALELNKGGDELEKAFEKGMV